MRSPDRGWKTLSAHEKSTGATQAARRIYVLYGYANLPQDAIARIVDELAESLGDHDQDVRVLGIRARRGRRVRGPLGKAWTAVREFSYILRSSILIAFQLRKTKAVVTLEYPAGTPLVGALARVLSRGRVVDVAWVMDLYGLMPGSIESAGRIAAIKSRLASVGLAQAGQRVVLGECMKRVLHSQTGLSSVVIPLWHRSTEEFSSAEGQNPGELLYSGNAREIHPLGALGTAIAGQTSEHRAALRVAGAGVSVDALATFADEERVSGIQVGPFVDDSALFESYSRASVHVVSLIEAATGTCVPSKTYAAMASGRAILYLGSPQGQAAEDIVRAGCGIVVPSNSVEEISDAIQKLVLDPGATREMGERAKKFWSKHRSVEALTPAWLDLLNGLR